MDLITSRLLIRDLRIEDASFIYRLLNEPSWIDYIGDRGIRNLEDAKRYIREGPMKSYEDFGFGLFLIIRKEDSESIGLCGLLQRPHLDAPDIGYALLREAEGCGFAFEAAEAVLQDARTRMGYKRIWASTNDSNMRSQSLLKRLGFNRYEGALEVIDKAKHYFLLEVN